MHWKYCIELFACMAEGCGGRGRLSGIVIRLRSGRSWVWIPEGENIFGKRPNVESHHSVHSSAEVKVEWSYSSTSQYAFVVCVWIIWPLPIRAVVELGNQSFAKWPACNVELLGIVCWGGFSDLLQGISAFTWIGWGMSARIPVALSRVRTFFLQDTDTE